MTSRRSPQRWSGRPTPPHPGPAPDAGTGRAWYRTDKGYEVVSGIYQSGIGQVDFTDQANAVVVGYAIPPRSPTQLGGDWWIYWYSGFIHESDITRGVLVGNLSDPATAGACKRNHLNSQTQEGTIR